MDRNKITIDTYNSTANMYQDKFMQMDLYNDTYDIFCNLVDYQNAEILDIACGPGNISNYLLKRRPDFKITGIDLAPNMITLAMQNNPKSNFHVMDCRNINQINKLFNGIICGFGMPYLSKEESNKLIVDSTNCLIKDGILYFSIMEGDYNKSGFETTSFSGEEKVFIYYHQSEFISNALKINGFEIIELTHKKYPEPDGSFLTDMIFIAKKL